MNIAVIGGTGAEGSGLASRLAKAGHRVVIGSRDPAKAKLIAAELQQKIAAWKRHRAWKRHVSSHQLALAPENLITFAHFTVSSATNWPN